MPIRHGGILASRASIWPRDHFRRSTIAPRLSRPTTWKDLADIDTDYGNCVVEIVGHSVLLVFGAPCQLRSLTGQDTAGPSHYQKWECASQQSTQSRYMFSLHFATGLATRSAVRNAKVSNADKFPMVTNAAR